ncbi:SGNH/GDSL hydrolase family protein [Consotaella aegiceratis]|uniref:SGNH/GDSL hydrolase family protein n=1 Tax=Consotaella aegiceratis TaxID=3097961 RepID=UPI002F422852
MKDFLRSALWALVGIVAALAVGEIVLRVATADQKSYVIEMWRYARTLKRVSDDPAIGHEHIPGKEARLEGVDVRINSLGLRGPEPSSDPQERIALIGDSITFGWGVPEERTLSSQLAALLPPGTDVLNGGVGNMNLSQIVAHWAKLSQKIKADTVVLFLTPRAAEIAQPPETNWLVEHSELAALAVTFVRQIASGAMGETSLTDAYRELWTGGEGRAGMDAAFDRLAALQAEDGYRVIVVMIPEPHDLQDYRFGFMTDIAEKEAEHRGWAFLDARPLLLDRPSADWWVSSDDVHPNGEAFSRIVHRLADML